MDRLIQKYYHEFAGMPATKPIVRYGITEDAFALVTLEVLYGRKLGYKIERNNLSKISSIIVAPPDNGIDLFYEREEGDEYSYDVIQVKYTSLDECSIKECFAVMQRSIKAYLKNPQSVAANLRTIIAETSFCESYKSNCNYYVVHIGSTKYGKDFSDNERVLTLDDLKTIKENIENSKVNHYKLQSDSFNNYLVYDNDKALLCNLRGFELAQLCLKFINHDESRNILFGQNLRDSLGTKTKTYFDMKATIDKEPSMFWHYNNGITIIAEKMDIHGGEGNVDNVELKEFSIINGAQTTSALGQYLKDAQMEKNEEKVENLKKVFVLARIMEINDRKIGENISIYNNSQNPITSRDMVSNREEQLFLNNWLLTCEKPNIYVEIRRGTKVPNNVKLYRHQITSNEELAQLAFASFLGETFYAKDKKKSLFNRDFANDYLVNEYYEKIFNNSPENVSEKGILFRKSNFEIDEVLFVKHLYSESKRIQKKHYDKMIEDESRKLLTAPKESAEKIENRIRMYKRNIEINGMCMFYCISLYFRIKEACGDTRQRRVFNYMQFYEFGKSKYRDEIILEFSNNFLSKTIEIIAKSLEGSSMNIWVRAQKSQKAFFEELENQITIGTNMMNMFSDFERKFKIDA